MIVTSASGLFAEAVAEGRGFDAVGRGGQLLRELLIDIAREVRRPERVAPQQGLDRVARRPRPNAVAWLPVSDWRVNRQAVTKPAPETVVRWSPAVCNV